MAAAQGSAGVPVVQSVGRALGRIGRGLFTGGSTPARLRLWIGATAVVAVLFAVLGAFGVGRRESSLRDARDAAQQLIEVQDVQVRLVHADALAS
ncbi:MAG: hypothetical protein Q7V88_08060, partial [Actinomycetota bacterium]|nr:hypothetical protein [Actinomycetota bacterium]